MTTGVLTKLRMLDLSSTQIAHAGGAALGAAFDRGAFPATAVPMMRSTIDLDGTPASDASSRAGTSLRR